MSLAFLLTTLVVVASPGTGALFTIAAGLARGGRASLVAALACTLGTLPHIAAAVLGVAALLNTSAAAFSTLKVLGVAYLLFMAWGTWRETGALEVDEEAAPQSTRRIVASGVLVNVLNPKLTIFFFAFLPQFVGAGGVLGMLGLSAVFMGATFVVFAVYGLLAAAMRRHVLSRPRVLAWMRRTFAASFLLLGARLAVAER